MSHNDPIMLPHQVRLRFKNPIIKEQFENFLQTYEGIPLRPHIVEPEGNIIEIEQDHFARFSDRIILLGSDPQAGIEILTPDLNARAQTQVPGPAIGAKVKTIFLVLGTRPEAIKMAPLFREIEKYPDAFNVQIIFTGQHKELLDGVLSIFHLPAHHNLNLLTPNQTIAELIAAILKKLTPILKQEKPDMILVQGDTTTAYAAAIAATDLGIPVGHVEAGLRSHDLKNPYPEEFFRVAADAISTLHFAPTPVSRQNLIAENISPDHIFVTGNTGIDAMYMAISSFMGWNIYRQGYLRWKMWRQGIQRPFLLITTHRRENFGQPLEDICQALLDVAFRHPHVQLVLPVHPNPHVTGVLHARLSGRPNICLLPPLDYAETLFLIQQSLFVVTDSGGLQEEAPTLGKPVLVLRETTERPEGVFAGRSKLIGRNREKVRDEILSLLSDPTLIKSMSDRTPLYGDGFAAKYTLQSIRTFFKKD